VEDDTSSRLLLQHAIDPKYQLKFAASVPEAWECLQGGSVDLILLDLALEGEEDGLDLTCALREQPKYRHLSIIVTTAHAFTTDRDRCLDAGCTEFLSKPLNLTKLQRLLNRYLESEKEG